MVMQAFIDESFDEDGAFVLGGCIASAESWAAFSKEWEELLPRFGILDSSGRYIFKMQEMAFLQERMDRVETFYRVIEKHAIALISCRIDSLELMRARSRILVPNTELIWERFHSYMVAYRFLIDKFHLHRSKMIPAIPAEEKVDFYFDDRSEKKAIISSWTGYVENRPDDIRCLYGATPRFENDHDFLPLQAADFWAWWVRKWHVDGTPEKIMARDFGVFKRGRGGRKMLIVDMVTNEEDLVANLAKIVRSHVPLEKPVIIMDSSSLPVS